MLFKLSHITKFSNPYEKRKVIEQLKINCTQRSVFFVALNVYLMFKCFYNVFKSNNSIIILRYF